MNGLYGGKGSQFILFSLTIFVLAVVIITFIRWVDNIARLGRLEHTIDKVEVTATEAMRKRQAAPRLGGVATFSPPDGSRAVFARTIGYVQRVDTEALQAQAVKSKLRIIVAALPGTFCTPNRPVAWVFLEASGNVSDDDTKAITATFDIGRSRVFEQDPRFGLLVLSEIASRALSPAVNDWGTAIGVTGRFVRLFAMRNEYGKAADVSRVQFDREAVPKLSMADMFDDAFTGVARDGAGNVEVVVRLLKTLESGIIIADMDNLKGINDTFGHAAGDLMIKLAAKVLRHTVRPEDVVARIGGDEFAILLPQTTNTDETLVRMRQGRETVQCDDTTKLPLQLSLGVATAHNSGQLRDAMLLADLRMYEDKNTNRQCRGED